MKILITGGTGLVGNGFNNKETEHDLVLVGSSDCNLVIKSDVEYMIYKTKPDAIIHLAAKVGGVKGNSDYIEEYFYKNMIMNLNVLNAAKNFNVPKVLSLLSTCIYPDNPKYPLTEDQIHEGEPHESNFGYAYAKRMLEVHSRTIRKQYGLKYITAVPNNIYGPKDNFDLNNSHVVPAVIRKIYEAKERGGNAIMWGDGSPLREFTYSKDIARALLFLIENYDKEDPINIGNTKEISILDLVDKISKILKYDGKIVWDTEKPVGQLKKPSSNKNFLKIYNNFEYTSLEEGLEETCKWFVSNYPNIRGY
jgi:GDP-L-fucose synthase